MRKKADRIKNGSYLTKYFTQFPNIIDDYGLDPYEFRVLIHYYRVGECWEGVRTTAEKCKMSVGKVTEVRRSLFEKGLITILPNGDGVTIEVVDKTKENLDKYRSPDEQGVHAMNGSVHHMNTTCSPDEHKNNPIKNNQEEGIGASTQKTIDEKKNEFKTSIAPFVGEFSKSICNEFYSYWSEVSKNGKKLKWEMQPTWETRKRLLRWKKNDDDRKAKQQNKFTPVEASVTSRAEGTTNQHILDQLYPKAQ